MGETLFLAHRMPFPPDRGDKIRSHHALRRLAQLGPVHVGTFADDAADFAAEPELAALAASHCLLRRSRPLPLAGLEALARRGPVLLAAFRSPELAAWVQGLLERRPITAIYAFSVQMGQYVPAGYRGRFVFDFVDVDSAKFEAYGARGRGPMAWVHAREGRLLRAEEARLAARADASLLVTREERELFVARLPADLRESCDVRVSPNGIDCAFFDPAPVVPEPRLLACGGPRLIFTGQMDYAPNAEAARRAMDHILPLVRRALPQASFHVVGRNPDAALLARHGRDGCHVWGRVDDMRPWLKAADGALVPLTIARGVQNKVLEAMAMELPVVLSPGAATGIPARDGTHFRVGADDAALAAAVVDLLSPGGGGAAMGRAARRFAVESASWDAALAPLGELLQPSGPALAAMAPRDAA